MRVCCRLRHKEKERVQQEMAKSRNIGENVSEFAQQVFNGLSKTYVVCVNFVSSVRFCCGRSGKAQCAEDSVRYLGRS